MRRVAKEEENGISEDLRKLLGHRFNLNGNVLMTAFISKIKSTYNPVDFIYLLILRFLIL